MSHVSTKPVIRKLAMSAALLIILPMNLSPCSEANAQPQGDSVNKASMRTQAIGDAAKTHALVEFRIAQDEASEGFSKRLDRQKKVLYVSDKIGLSIADIDSVVPGWDEKSKLIISLKLTETGGFYQN